MLFDAVVTVAADIVAAVTASLTSITLQFPVCQALYFI